jgi:methyl-accepting chemotaxis protein
MRVTLWRDVGERDAAKAAVLEESFAQSRQHLEASLKDYEPLISDEKDKGLLRADRDDLAAFYALGEQVLALARAGKRSDACDLLSDRRALSSKLVQDFATHRQYNKDLGKQGSSDAADIKSRSTMVGVALTAVTVIVIALLGYAVFRRLTRQLGGEPAAVAAVAAKVATGDLSSRITLADGDTKSLFATVAKMQSNLRERAERDRLAAAEKELINEEMAKNAAEGARIRTALDRASVGMMLVDNDDKIIYANEFSSGMFRRNAEEIRRHLGQFDAERIVGSPFGVFARDSSEALSRLSGSHEREVKFGTVTLKMQANPVLDDRGHRQGSVVQWVDRTQEVLTEEEIKVAVSKAIDGDLTMRVPEDGKEGFFKALALGMNELLGNMEDVVRTMAQAAGEVRTGADEISRGNLDLSQRTEEQASSLEQTAASMEEMTTTVKNNADNAAQANQLAAAAREHAERGGKVVGTAVAAMNEINVASKRIADIIGVIDDIAFQTNLLALNAAVEAARAGEQGRGFAVVASEVRNLASRSAGAAKEIKALIQDSVSKVSEGAKLVDESGQVLTEIVTGVKKVTDVMAEITVSSREQASGIDQVNKAVSSMDTVTQQNAALVEQASAASQTLTEQAANLIQLIARYKYSGAIGVARVVASPPSAPRVERRSASRPWSGRPKAGAAPARPSAAESAPRKSGGDDWSEF